MTPSPSPPPQGRSAELHGPLAARNHAPGARSASRRRWAWRPALLGATLLLGIALTACGAASSSPSKVPSAPGKSAASQAYRSCLTAHGLVTKPAGTSSPSPGGPQSSAQGKAARAACRSLRPGSARGAYRSCLAAHGLVAKPAGKSSPSPGGTPSSARGKAARAACRSLRPKRAAPGSPSPTKSP